VALLGHVLAHTSREEPLARFVEPDACALLDQHADFAQFVFGQAHWAALTFAYRSRFNSLPAATTKRSSTIAD
jgi:hypothetical protein